MAEAWFYCPDISSDRILLPADEAHHAVRSRRLRSGASVAAFDGHGRVASGTLRISAGRRNRTQQVWIDVRQRDQQPAPPAPLTLIVATPRPSRLDWMIEKCTELGVATLVLCRFARSVQRPAAVQPDRLRRIAIEACKQARRATLPDLRQADDPQAALREASCARQLVAHRCPQARPIGELLGQPPTPGALSVVIGPEGGLSDAELHALMEQGAIPVDLGPYVLRIETAAVAVAALWQMTRGG